MGKSSSKKTPPKQPRVLLIDLENAPILGWAWDMFETNVVAIAEDWYLLAFGYRWLGEKKITVRCLPDYARYKKDRQDDADLVADLWQVLDQCDIAIAHNGDAFDFRKAYARFAVHNLPPPSPFQTIDTLKAARRYFKFSSNKLNSLGNILKVGRKVKHEGWPLWQGCMEGDPRAWTKMRSYNRRDVLLLARVYAKLRPFIKNHPNLSVYSGHQNCCPSCESAHVQRRGIMISRSVRRQRYQCRGCGAWFSGERIK